MLTRIIYLLFIILSLQCSKGLCLDLITECANAPILANKTIGEATVDGNLLKTFNYATWQIILDASDIIVANVSTSSTP